MAKTKKFSPEQKSKIVIELLSNEENDRASQQGVSCETTGT